MTELLKCKSVCATRRRRTPCSTSWFTGSVEILDASIDHQGRGAACRFGGAFNGLEQKWGRCRRLKLWADSYGEDSR